MSAPPVAPNRLRLFRPPQGSNAMHLAEILRQETTGGFLMLGATVIALVVATIAPGWYQQVSHIHLGPLTLAHWASDGLLTIFFFVAGLELKRELVEGSLSRPADALVPIVAAITGMAVPAGFYLAINAFAPSGVFTGWPIPMATDIAFALAVLAIVGSDMPTALRAFLLTLAIVDDLGAIIVIAIAFSHGLSLLWLGAAVAGLVVWAILQRKRVDTGWIYIVLGVAIWWCMYQSGIHATIAGVAMGLLTTMGKPNVRHDDIAYRFQHRVEPVSAGFAVPVFALFAAGVPLSLGALAAVWTQPHALGIVVGLVAGKVVGIFLGAWATARFTTAELGQGIEWGDVLAAAQLAGIGFTVSLLMSELAFTDNAVLTSQAKMAVLVASGLSAVLGAIIVRVRLRQHREAARARAAEGEVPATDHSAPQ